jgi:hypothetical protein
LWGLISRDVGIPEVRAETEEALFDNIAPLLTRERVIWSPA